MFIKKPHNEWFEGILYKYDKTKDKRTYKNNPDDYIEDDDYTEDGYITFGEKFRYKQYTDENGRRFPLPGLKSNTRTYVIETSNTDLIFDVDDKISLINSETKWKITNVSNNRKNHKTKATYLLPGLYEEYNSNTVIELS